MDASTQTENISAVSGILNVMLLFIIEETRNEERRIQREFNIKFSKEMDERYEEDVYNSYFDEDEIDRMAYDYDSNFNSHNKYNTSVYDSVDNFHRGKSSNAKKKKSKRSVSCAPIPDAHDRYEENNAYYDVTFFKDNVIYY